MLAAVFTGVGTSMLCLKVGRLYGSVSLGDSLTAGAISLLLAALLYFVGIGIPSEGRLFYIAALPLMSGLLLSMGSADPFPSAATGESEGRPRSPVRHLYRKLVAASALVALTAGVGKGISSSLVDNALFAREGSIIVFCIGVIAVAVAWAVNRGDAVRGARQAYSALMVMGMALMLGTCFGLDISLLSVGKEALWLMFSCFMAYLAFRFDLSPVRVFGIGQGVYFLASTAGWALGAAIAPWYGEAMVRMGVGVALTFLVIIVLVYVFPENDLKRIMAWSVDGDAICSTRGVRDGAPTEGATTGSKGVAEPSAATHSLTRAADPRYGLSARELEILDLFAQGRSANWIADSLTISKNTVRSHLRAIYTKLDVHTRQELLDFLAG